MAGTDVNLGYQAQGALPVANGGTGATTLTSGSVLVGNGTSAVSLVAPSTSGNLLVSNGSTWTSAAPLPRIGTTTSSATPSITVTSYDQFNITALATNITSMTSGLSGSLVDGQKLMIRIKDNGTSRTITWGSSYQSSGVATLLAATVASKTHFVGLIYDSVVAKLICVAVDAVGY